MHKNVLFRGCTRPPMFLGVPYIPFAVGAGACLLLTFYINMFCLLLLPIVIFIMRQMARRDEMIFRLLGLRWQFRTKVRNLPHHSGMWVFSPNLYRDRTSGSRN
ncbi:type IV secretion system protein VirB3 [Lysobacter solisilvae (ex Woo and Kim 2020)]|uniref:VirB3 family type IV secretion system protein n=1 Tax=Agrilutibacter terrestris TaxID=2865112 RepID=A0A7H0FXV9_9GAMM|nr:VirB3 family type IV secretion system protein [Lysobacter terrestris]QNP40875.1 VirB3 family type IV secretion system protein [Lysobacter terrestris]